MSYYKEAQAIISELGKTIGMPDLAFDENKFCALCLDEKIVVNLQYNEASEAMILHAGVGALSPDKDDIGTLRMLLDANCYWKETGGATLGVDLESRLVILAYAIPMPLSNPNHFQPILFQFVDMVEAWMKRLGTFEEQPAS